MMDAAVYGQSHARVHTILVVEDEVLIRLFLAEELRHAGFTVSEASTADEACTILTAGMKVDLVLTDIRMPGSMDGVALAGWIRAKFPNTKICFVSANIRPDDASLADANFSKPFQLNELLRKVGQLLPEVEQSSAAKG